MLTQLQMDLHATLANRELGTLLGGGEGDQYVAESDAWLRAQGVVNPERFAAAF